MENKTKIIITRSNEWMNRLRSYKVLIDEIAVGAIKNGSSEEFIITPGKHTVKCKLAWYSSPEFAVDLKQDEIIYLRTKGALGISFWIIYFLFLSAFVFINLNRKNLSPQFIDDARIGFFVIMALFLLYIFSLGRKKYLRLEKDKKNIFSK